MNTKTLNIEFLTSLGACQEGIEFVKRANLEGFPLSLLPEVKGDYNGFVNWLRDQLETEREYNTQGLMTKEIYPWGDVRQWEYNDQGLKTKEIYPSGDVHQWEYNDQGLKTKEITPSGDVYQWEYIFNKNNRLVEVKGDYDTLLIPEW